MEDFLSRFGDSLVFEHTATFFFNEDSEDDAHPILKNPIPKPNPNGKPTFQRRFLFRIFRSIHNLTISHIYPDYMTLWNSISNHRRSFKTQTRNLHTFLLELPRNRGKNDRDHYHDLDLFIKRYREHYAEIESELECLETQMRILEKKLKVDLKLMDLKLMDTGKKANMLIVLDAVINLYRSNHRKEMMVLLAEKTAYEFRFLGLKGLISNDVGAFDFAYDPRALHRFNLGKSSKPLRFRKLSRDGISRLNWGNSSRLLLLREWSRDGK